MVDVSKYISVDYKLSDRLSTKKMFSRKKGETEINVLLDEPLTSDSCTKVVIEIVKYILYQKQQIPFVYEALARKFQTNVQATDRNAVSFKNLSNTLKNVSDHISSQFFLEGCDMKEVAVLLGATIFSPKVYIGIEFPPYILNSKQHKEYQHSSRKPLLKLMKAILECEEFQEAMSAPLGVTNTFIMLKKSDRNSVSDYFLPKPQYTPPTETTRLDCFKIKLCHDNQVDIPCTCRTLIKIYHDSCKTDSENETDVQCSQYNGSTQSLYQWYQSKQVIRGFKFYS
ncbi:hypothetical protein DMN91_007639 [Ooceraea biroi]|uniref:MAD2L1-binding protein n=1 Tax=Ooceraea biroi TaxID=2015173 RepID=A0A3L8DLE2_OOCBI|nr:MAD2L1-binding protein [Ooceraea biroi]RLU21023.1 hypothetical protein DMN91_007639 [Ooceraea biroi]